MKGSVDLLNELIEIARDGQKFYQEAAGKVKEPELQTVFREQAKVRDRLIGDLAQHVADDGEAPSDDTTLLGASRMLYADVRARLSSDGDAVYIDQLEQAEDRLLDHYRKAVDESNSEDIRHILKAHLPMVKAAHARMSALKHHQHVR